VYRLAAMEVDGSEFKRLASHHEPIAANTKKPQVRDFILSLIVLFTGVYIPKFFLPSQEELQARPIPFQKTAAGDVILDFELNKPMVDPPTIPCEC
jgi:hypothetical protein